VCFCCYRGAAECVSPGARDRAGDRLACSETRHSAAALVLARSARFRRGAESLAAISAGRSPRLGPAQVIYTASPIFLPGAFNPLPTRLAISRGASEVVIVPPPGMLRSPPRPKIVFKNRPDDDSTQRAIEGLVRSVAGAANGNRNSMLYWASRCMAEKIALHAIAPEEARFLLEKAGLEAGLFANEVAATVRSGLRHGDA
jgi:hypothetical protein